MAVETTTKQDTKLNDRVHANSLITNFEVILIRDGHPFNSATTSHAIDAVQRLWLSHEPTSRCSKAQGMFDTRYRAYQSVNELPMMYVSFNIPAT